MPLHRDHSYLCVPNLTKKIGRLGFPRRIPNMATLKCHCCGGGFLKQPKPLNRFSRVIRQKNRFRPMRCPWWVKKIPPKISPPKWAKPPFPMHFNGNRNANNFWMECPIFTTCGWNIRTINVRQHATSTRWLRLTRLQMQVTWLLRAVYWTGQTWSQWQSWSQMKSDENATFAEEVKTSTVHCSTILSGIRCGAYS